MYRYSYAKSSQGRSKGTCPACGSKRRFSFFWDHELQQIAPPEYGRCDRTNACGYENRPEGQVLTTKVNYIEPPTSYVSKEMLLPTLKQRYDNVLATYLIENFPDAKQVIDDYVLGTVEIWGGLFPIFWYVDDFGLIRSGKIMNYELVDGAPHRTKHSEYWDNVKWFHQDINGFNYKQVSFGSHLLKKYPEKDVKIVESEKTALIMACLRPQYIWLATSSDTGLQPHLLPNLKDRDVEVLPDKGQRTFDYWSVKSKELLSENLVKSIKVSTFVEEREELGTGDDIADYVTMKLC